MPFKGIPGSSVYIRSTVPCVLPCIFGIKYGTPFKELELPYKRNDGIKEQIDTITNSYNKWLYLFHISSC